MIYIHGCGHFWPENIISNKFLEDLDIGTTNEWILERVGIHSRRTVLPLEYIKETYNRNPLAAKEASLYSNIQTGAKAAFMAIEKAGIKKEDIGMVISGSCTPEHCCPSEACTIAAEIGIEVPSLDINSACSSFAAQLNFINMMDPSKLPPYVLILNPENNTRSIDYRDRGSSVLWGDCSTAVVISTSIKSKYQINYTFLDSSPKGWPKVMFSSHGHFEQLGRAVQTFAIKTSHLIINKLREEIPGNLQHNVKFIGHQANLMMLKSVCSRAEIADENHIYNIDRYGNCGAAGAPSVLSENWENFNPGDIIMLGVVGAGLSWGGMLIKVGSSDEL